ncbi:hypothetical protein DERF_004174 [Dermatophagoides farinae]|uniref:Uncharacterized protein n=1 Tax=Dermatophagoides farinae TaxID=6954 RepID=A0A922L9R4_DERFA|nr:hypothetical protein DERF_004174 [Dermatophagoides farinae]
MNNYLEIILKKNIHIQKRNEQEKKINNNRKEDLYADLVQKKRSQISSRESIDYQYILENDNDNDKFNGSNQLDPVILINDNSVVKSKKQNWIVQVSYTVLGWLVTS